MTGVTLTVLGSAGSHPGPDRACSSYLLESEGFRLVLDLGNGALTNLLQRLDARQVDAVLLSHRHPDHWADLVGLYYALRFHRDGQQSVPVHGPPGIQAFIGQLLPGDEVFPQVCRFTEVEPGDQLDIGPFTLQMFGSNHPVPTVATRASVGATVIAYSGDSDVAPQLVDCARGADLFVCDCTWLAAEGPFPAGVHMTGKGAGELAADAGVRRLLVTHVWPGVDPAAVAAEVSEAFGGDILIARDLMEIRL